MKEDLWENYRGTDGSKGLYLAFLGTVYDVSSGKDHYGPGGGYHFFAGRDGTRGYLTGDFTEAGLTDDLSDLSVDLFSSLADWRTFYEESYPVVGKLAGKFYDSNGNPTDALEEVVSRIAAAKQNEKHEREMRQKFPPCNVKSSAAEGTKVWCTTKSGGIERDWVGYPRLFKTANREPMCVCSREINSDNPNLGEYQGCLPGASSCITKPPK